ncbi:hypothetical protein BGW36DRAFT_430610 [Talaromyces proteolyticus]|uniref:arginine--tRNA ligase n=1 Tax=Talaromyces proteolyticus TaxID=1131652 RepID=A0AAD4PT88_9EURO|nr:uncharacterized protein BGW36DRAFT_430610 [Talaromyces proteolyticus]KAH8692865.1 hypothetical protein BGW36DRAFT_430610 [Talaromyces proteolyticus]
MTTLTLPELEAHLGGLGMNIPIPKFQAVEVLNRPLDIARAYLTDILSNLAECDPDVAYKSIYWPNNIFNGDLVVILPKLSRDADFKTVALRLTQKFKCPLFILPFQDGVHLRITFSSQMLPRFLLPYIYDRLNIYGRHLALGIRDHSSPELERKKLVVEFSSPNIASEFQAKHFKSTIFGAHVACLYESMNWDVVRLNYLGDWGKPIGLLGVGWEKFGSEDEFQVNSARHLLEIYHKIQELFIPQLAASKKIRDEGGDPAEVESQGLFAERNAYFKRMEDGEEQAIALWKRVRDVNIENYTKLYSRLGITFDEYSGESQVSLEAMTEVEEILKSKGLTEEKSGSWMIDLTKHAGKKLGTAIIRDRTGSSTYLLRDLAAVLERFRKYSFDKMIYVVAADQHTTHFARLFKILELMDMPDLASRLQHVQFCDSMNVSQQVQDKLDLMNTMPDEILAECERAIQNSLEKNPEKATPLVGKNDVETIPMIVTNALIAEELSSRRANNHASFDISRIQSFEPGTGLDLQYWYARLCSIVETSYLESSTSLSEEEWESLEQEDEVDLLRLLVQYPDITYSVYETLEPATVLTYLSNVTAQLSMIIPDNEEDGSVASPAHATLYEATRRVLESGMKLLGMNFGK